MTVRTSHEVLFCLCLENRKKGFISKILFSKEDPVSDLEYPRRNGMRWRFFSSSLLLSSSSFSFFFFFFILLIVLVIGKTNWRKIPVEITSYNELTKEMVDFQRKKEKKKKKSFDRSRSKSERQSLQAPWRLLRAG